MTGDELRPEPTTSSVSPVPHLPGPIPDVIASAIMVQVRAEWIDFYDAHYHRVVRFLMHFGASLLDAQDAAQEAFTESYDLMTGNPDRWQAVNNKAAWIRTVALRRYKRPPGSRKRLLTVSHEIPDTPAPSPGHDELTAQAQFVLHALHSLGEEERTVIAFDLDDIPVADTAGALGITQQQVRDIRKKARANLKRELVGKTTPGRRQP